RLLRPRPARRALPARVRGHDLRDRLHVDALRVTNRAATQRVAAAQVHAPRPSRQRDIVPQLRPPAQCQEESAASRAFGRTRGKTPFPPQPPSIHYVRPSPACRRARLAAARSKTEYEECGPCPVTPPRTFVTFSWPVKGVVARRRS